MPKIIAWKCPHSGKLFEDEKKYKTHLARMSRHAREQTRLIGKRMEILNAGVEFRARIKTLPELAKAFIREQDIFWDLSKVTDGWRWDSWLKSQKTKKPMPMPKLADFSEFRLTYNPLVSNTHYCPLNGVTNWSRREKMPGGSPIPHGYPGWEGRVGIEVIWPEELDGDYVASEFFKGSCAHTGTGGGGGMHNGRQRFSWDFRLFAADWPGLNETLQAYLLAVEKHKVWRAIGGQVDTEFEALKESIESFTL